MATEVVASWRNNHDESLMTLNHHQQPLSQHVFASDKIYILNQDGVQRFPHLECRRCQLTHTHKKGATCWEGEQQQPPPSFYF